MMNVALVGNEQEVWGEFYLERDYPGPVHVYAAVWRVFLWSLFLVVFVTLLLGRFLLGRILRPLERLYSAVCQIERGDYALDLEVNRRDEVGILCREFAQMVEALRRREKDLEAERHRAERMADLDPLTHVPNRRFLERYAKRLMEEQKPFALVFVDFDGFKNVNDVLGHTEGDHLLRRIALWFERNIRREDVVARYGGDEFCLLFPGLGQKETEAVMERLVVGFGEANFASGLLLSFSYGVAVYPEEGRDFDALLLFSDRKMYAQKRGKSPVDRCG